MKKKILIRIGSLLGGGAEKTLINYLKNINQNKYEIDLLLNVNFGVYLTQVPEWVHIYSISEYQNHKRFPFNYIGKLWNVLRIRFYDHFLNILYINKLKRKKYDIEIAFIHSLAGPVSRSPNQKSKKIVFVHSDMNNVRKKLDRNLVQDMYLGFSKSDCILSVTSAVQESLESSPYPVLAQKQVIYNPIDNHDISKKSKENIEVFTKTGRVDILALGRFSKEKGFDRLIKVAENLKNNGQLNFKIHLMGDGPEKIKLKELVKELQVENHIHFLGFKPNPYPYISKADFIAIPSLQEGYSLVVAEAMILNTPIVSTQTIGPTELLKNGLLGMLVENNEQGLYNGILEFILKPNLMSHYKKKMKEIPFEDNLKNSIEKLEQILDTI